MIIIATGMTTANAMILPIVIEWLFFLKEKEKGRKEGKKRKEKEISRSNP